MNQYIVIKKISILYCYYVMKGVMLVFFYHYTALVIHTQLDIVPRESNTFPHPVAKTQGTLAL